MTHTSNKNKYQLNVLLTNLVGEDINPQIFLKMNSMFNYFSTNKITKPIDFLINEQKDVVLNTDPSCLEIEKYISVASLRHKRKVEMICQDMGTHCLLAPIVTNGEIYVMRSNKNNFSIIHTTCNIIDCANAKLSFGVHIQFEYKGETLYKIESGLQILINDMIVHVTDNGGIYELPSKGKRKGHKTRIKEILENLSIIKAEKNVFTTIFIELTHEILYILCKSINKTLNPEILSYYILRTRNIRDTLSHQRELQYYFDKFSEKDFGKSNLDYKKLIIQKSQTCSTNDISSETNPLLVCPAGVSQECNAVMVTGDINSEAENVYNIRGDTLLSKATTEGDINNSNNEEVVEEDTAVEIASRNNVNDAPRSERKIGEDKEALPDENKEKDVKTVETDPNLLVEESKPEKQTDDDKTNVDDDDWLEPLEKKKNIVYVMSNPQTVKKIYTEEEEALRGVPVSKGKEPERGTKKWKIKFDANKNKKPPTKKELPMFEPVMKISSSKLLSGVNSLDFMGSVLSNNSQSLRMHARTENYSKEIMAIGLNQYNDFIKLITNFRTVIIDYANLTSLQETSKKSVDSLIVFLQYLGLVVILVHIDGCCSSIKTDLNILCHECFDDDIMLKISGSLNDTVILSNDNFLDIKKNMTKNRMNEIGLCEYVGKAHIWKDMYCIKIKRIKDHDGIMRMIEYNTIPTNLMNNDPTENAKLVTSQIVYKCRKPIVISISPSKLRGDLRASIRSVYSIGTIVCLNLSETSSDINPMIDELTWDLLDKVKRIKIQENITLKETVDIMLTVHLGKLVIVNRKGEYCVLSQKYMADIINLIEDFKNKSITTKFCTMLHPSLEILDDNDANWAAELMTTRQPRILMIDRLTNLDMALLEMGSEIFIIKVEPSLINDLCYSIIDPLHSNKNYTTVIPSLPITSSTRVSLSYWPYDKTEYNTGITTTAMHKHDTGDIFRAFSSLKSSYNGSNDMPSRTLMSDDGVMLNVLQVVVPQELRKCGDQCPIKLLGDFTSVWLDMPYQLVCETYTTLCAQYANSDDALFTGADKETGMSSDWLSRETVFQLRDLLWMDAANAVSSVTRDLMSYFNRLIRGDTIENIPKMVKAIKKTGVFEASEGGVLSVQFRLPLASCQMMISYPKSNGNKESDLLVTLLVNPSPPISISYISMCMGTDITFDNAYNDEICALYEGESFEPSFNMVNQLGDYDLLAPLLMCYGVFAPGFRMIGLPVDEAFARVSSALLGRYIMPIRLSKDPDEVKANLTIGQYIMYRESGSTSVLSGISLGKEAIDVNNIIHQIFMVLASVVTSRSKRRCIVIALAEVIPLVGMSNVNKHLSSCMGVSISSEERMTVARCIETMMGVDFRSKNITTCNIKKVVIKPQVNPIMNNVETFHKNSSVFVRISDTSEQKLNVGYNTFTEVDVINAKPLLAYNSSYKDVSLKILFKEKDEEFTMNEILVKERPQLDNDSWSTIEIGTMVELINEMQCRVLQCSKFLKDIYISFSPCVFKMLKKSRRFRADFFFPNDFVIIVNDNAVVHLLKYILVENISKDYAELLLKEYLIREESDNKIETNIDDEDCQTPTIELPDETRIIEVVDEEHNDIEPEIINDYIETPPNDEERKDEERVKVEVDTINITTNYRQTGATDGIGYQDNDREIHFGGGHAKTAVMNLSIVAIVAMIVGVIIFQFFVRYNPLTGLLMSVYKKLFAKKKTFMERVLTPSLLKPIKTAFFGIMTYKLLSV